MPKILIVDDDSLIRELLLQVLEPFEENGVTLLSAQNGVIAVEVINKELPDMVFLDVMMPKMNGFEVCRIVKSTAALKDIYIVMLTAKGQEVDKQNATAAGVDYYITKPFNISEIIKKVNEVLNMNVS
jgi:DNA-binding response OmpR family regulator